MTELYWYWGKIDENGVQVRIATLPGGDESSSLPDPCFIFIPWVRIEYLNSVVASLSRQGYDMPGSGHCVGEWVCGKPHTPECPIGVRKEPEKGLEHGTERIFGRSWKCPDCGASFTYLRQGPQEEKSEADGTESEK